MSLLALVENSFQESIRVKSLAQDKLAAKIVAAGLLMRTALNAGGKILVCGNGGSAADAQHFTAELVNRFLQEREPLPAITLSADTSVLTAIANDYSYDDIFAKQVLALGTTNDILLAISTSGNSRNIEKAIQTALARGVKVVALTGNGGGAVSGLIANSDSIELCVPDKTLTPRIQETHILILHCLCAIIESNF